MPRTDEQIVADANDLARIGASRPTASSRGSNLNISTPRSHMADKSNIEWTDATWNPIVGCSIHSPGCANCYAMPMAARINADELSFAEGPLSYEFIPTRTYERWRIRDRLDNPVGAAETEEEAKEAVDWLNRKE